MPVHAVLHVVLDFKILKGNAMSRSKINEAGKELTVDNGSILMSVVAGEQLKFDVTLLWLTNLTGYVISAKLVEAVSDSTTPTEVKPGGFSTVLNKGNGYISGVDDGDNIFSITIPYSLATSLTTPPTPDNSTFMFIDVEVGESGTGDTNSGVTSSVSPTKQIWKPLRGLLEVLYSPTGV